MDANIKETEQGNIRLTHIITFITFYLLNADHPALSNLTERATVYTSIIPLLLILCYTCNFLP